MIVRRGTVVTADSRGVYVSVSELGGVYGPLEIIVTDKADVPVYEEGDRVLVAQVGVVKEDLIVIGFAIRYEPPV